MHKNKHKINYVKKYQKIQPLNIKISSQKNSILFIQFYDEHNVDTITHDNNKKYCDKNMIDYVTLSNKLNRYQCIHDIMINKEYDYEYIIFAESFMLIISKENDNKSFNRIISQAGDVDLVVSRCVDKNTINTDIMIFRKSEWSLYKLHQLYYDFSADILLDQIYTPYKNSPFSDKNKLSLGRGIPHNMSFICIYNEHSFGSPTSSFIQNIKDGVSTTHNIVYPWCDINGFYEIKQKYRYDTQFSHEIKKEQKIPKIIFQTMETTLLPMKIKNIIRTWISINPSYRYVYFNALDRRNFIKKNFNDDVYKAYEKLIPGAFKADLWRLCVLYIHGGVYIDIRSRALRPLDFFIEKKDKLIIPTDRLPCMVWNGFICSSPCHLFIKNCIYNIQQKISNNEYCKNPLDITGPSILGKLLNKYIFRDKLSNFDEENHVFNKFNIKILSHTYFSYPYVRYKNVNVISKKASLDDREFSAINGTERYHSAWLNGNVYKFSLF